MLVGAFYPMIFSPTDAPFNLGFVFGAIEYIQPGVYVCGSMRLFEADKLCKDADTVKFKELQA